MIFTKLYPFSIFIGIVSAASYFFENKLSRSFHYSERFSYRFFLVTALVVCTLLHRTTASPDTFWNEGKLSEYAKEALSPAAIVFQTGFLGIASTYATTQDVATFIQTFQQTGSQLQDGLDEVIRPIYVGAQGDIERTLAQYFTEGKITHLVGIIHTPTPATPLCIRGEISENLVDVSMKEDPKRLYTVMKRPEIIRDYMDKGALLIVAYPQVGLHSRTAEQQAIFQEVREKYPDHLMDLPLDCVEMQKDMVGATYLFRTKEGDWMAFGIMASQANAPDDAKVWGMWFGPIRDPLIYSRVHSVFAYLHSVQSKDLSSLLLDVN